MKSKKILLESGLKTTHFPINATQQMHHSKNKGKKGRVGG